MWFILFLVVLSPYTALIPGAISMFAAVTGRIKIYRNPFNIGLILLFLWSVFSGLMNNSISSILISLVLLLYFCLSAAIENIITTTEKAEKVLRYLLYFSVPVAIFGIIEKVAFATGNVFMLDKILGVSKTEGLSHRVYATFGNPNVAGGWFAVMVLIALYMFFKSSKGDKIFYSSLMFLFSLTVMLTGSTGAMMALAAGLFIYILLRKKVNKYVLAGIVLVGLTMFAVLLKNIDTVNALVGHNLLNSLTSRLSIWQGCINMFGYKPLTGWGLLGIYERGPFFINFHAHVIHGHNLLLSILTCLGSIGLYIYVVMRFYTFSSLKVLKDEKCELFVLLASIQALFIAHGLLDFTIITPQAGMMFVGTCAVINSLARQYSLVPSSKMVPLFGKYAAIKKHFRIDS